MVQFRGVVLSLLATAVCGGCQQPAVSGSVMGLPFRHKRALFDSPPVGGGPNAPGQSITKVWLNDLEHGECGDQVGGLGAELIFTLSEGQSADQTVMHPGTFRMGPGINGASFYEIRHYLGGDFLFANADQGEAVIDSVSPTELSGSVDVTLGSDHLSGSFTATYCENKF